MMYTLIFIAYFSYGSSVLTQAGFQSVDECNRAAQVMIARFNEYDKSFTRTEWACK